MPSLPANGLANLKLVTLGNRKLRLTKKAHSLLEAPNPELTIPPRLRSDVKIDSRGT